MDYIFVVWTINGKGHFFTLNLHKTFHIHTTHIASRTSLCDVKKKKKNEPSRDAWQMWNVKNYSLFKRGIRFFLRVSECVKPCLLPENEFVRCVKRMRALRASLHCRCFTSTIDDLVLCLYVSIILLLYLLYVYITPTHWSHIFWILFHFIWQSGTRVAQSHGSI